MNACTAFDKLDDIRTFLPGISEAEYELRANLRSKRNCASAVIANTESDTARALAWMCSEYATAYVYASVDPNTLKEVTRFCHRLMRTSMQAETVDGWWG